MNLFICFTFYILCDYKLGDYKMKKMIFTVVTVLMFSVSAKAETVIVIDDNGVVKQQIVTSNPTNYVTTTQNVTVVRESPSVQNAYYYDAPSTTGAVLAGVTTAVVGALLYNEFKPEKPHYKPAPIRSAHKLKNAPKHKPAGMNMNKPHGKK